MYQVVNGSVVNENGEIAVRWNRLMQKYIRVGSREYIFVVKSNIALAWIHPDDVEKVLAIQISCCGGRAALACTLANELSVRRWLGISIW